LTSAGAGLVGSGKRYADQFSLATYPLPIALAQFPTVTLEKVGVRRFAFVGKLAYHRAGVDCQGRIVTRASLIGFCQNVATAAADVFVQLKLYTADSRDNST
jgi:hypothetical protein